MELPRTVDQAGAKRQSSPKCCYERSLQGQVTLTDRRWVWTRVRVWLDSSLVRELTHTRRCKRHEWARPAASESSLVKSPKLHIRKRVRHSWINTRQNLTNHRLKMYGARANHSTKKYFQTSRCVTEPAGELRPPESFSGSWNWCFLSISWICLQQKFLDEKDNQACINCRCS